MKTDNLISLLAEDATIRTPLHAMLWCALIGGVVISVALLVSTVGVRENIASAVQTVRVVFKMIATLALAVSACSLVFRVGRPGLSLRRSVLSLLVPVLLVGGGVAIEIAAIPKDSWSTALIGRNAALCTILIPLFALPPLGGFLWALKTTAPESPVAAGAAAGLAAAGLAASLYAWHCPDDSPLFLAIWYTMAIAIVTSFGAVVGSHLLRW